MICHNCKHYDQITNKCKLDLKPISNNCNLFLVNNDIPEFMKGFSKWK